MYVTTFFFFNESCLITANSKQAALESSKSVTQGQAFVKIIITCIARYVRKFMVQIFQLCVLYAVIMYVHKRFTRRKRKSLMDFRFQKQILSLFGESEKDN